MSLINKLTQQQIDKLPEYRDRWLAHGLSTEPVSRKEAEAAVADAYRAANLAPPRIFVWLDSPFAGAIGAEMLRQSAQVGAQVWAQVRAQVGAQVRDQVRAQVRAQVRDQVWDQVRDQVRDQVGAQVRDQVGAQVWAQVRDQVGAQVWAQVRDQVRDQVWDQVWDQVRDQVRDQVGAQVRDQVRDQVWDQVRDQVGAQVRDQVWAQVGRACYGQHDANWLAFYEFFGCECGLEVCDRLNGLTATAMHCGWWWPFAGAVVLTERPTVLNRDERGRLHCENGPAILYPDGWGIWAWHGVRLHRDIIERPESITVEQIEYERNAEIRRVMITRYGQDRYLLDSGAKLVHRDDWGTLYRKELADDEPLVMVKVVNSTPEPDGSFKDYFLRVPPNIETSREAVAWTFDVPTEDYSPLVET